MIKESIKTRFGDTCKRMILEGQYTVQDGLAMIPYGIALRRLLDSKLAIHVCKPIYQNEPEYFALCDKPLVDLGLHECRYSPNFGVISFHPEQLGSTIEVYVEAMPQ